MKFKKIKKQDVTSVRRPVPKITESFRRDNVVLSTKQKEIIKHRQSVSQRQSEIKHERARRRQIRRLLLVVFLLVGAFILFQNTAKTVTVASNAGAGKNLDTYQLKLLDIFKEQTILSQTWLVDKQKVSESFKQDFPAVQSVNLETKPFNRTIKADIRFRQPFYLWKDVSGQSKYIDKEGVLFTEVMTKAKKDQDLVLIEDQSGLVGGQGSLVVSGSLLKFISGLQPGLAEVFGQQVEIEKMIIPSSTREIQVKTNAGAYLLKFNTSRGVGEQINDLKLITTHLRNSGVTPANYIDLRVANKVFYK